MKKIFLSLVLSVVTLVVFIGCTPKTYKVTFKQDNGQQDIIKEVKRGEKVAKPNDPLKEGYVFKFWAENDQEFNFEKKIVKNHVLVAKWQEQTTGLKVVLPEEIKVTTPNVDLANLDKGTKLDFEITVPNHHYVKTILANTFDITNNLKETNKFSFVVNRNVTFKVEFDVLPNVKAEVAEQFEKVKDIVVEQLDSEPKLTLEQVRAKVAENLDLTFVNLEVVQKEEKYVVTLTSKKVNTYSLEKEITVTYKKSELHKVTTNQNFTLLTQNINLDAVKHGVELEFVVVVATGKVIDTLTANGKDIKQTLTAENKFKIKVEENLVLDVTFKVDEAFVNQEVQAELDKIQTVQTLDVVDANELAEDKIKVELLKLVDNALVELTIVKNTNDYTVTLKSKKLETVTKSKNITVKYNKYYSVTLPAEITVEGLQDLNKVAANTKLTFVVTVANGLKVKTLTANDQDIKSTLTAQNKFEYIVNAKTTIAVTFEADPVIIGQEVQAELDKIQSAQTLDVVDATELTVEKISEELLKIVDNTLVELQVVKNATNYTVKLISKKLATVTKEKTFTVAYNQFYSVTVPTEIIVEGSQDLNKVATGTQLTFVVTLPEGMRVATLKANAEDIKPTLNGNKFDYTVNKKIEFKVTFEHDPAFVEQEVQTELDKIQTVQTLDVVDANELAEDKIKVELLKLVDNTLVELTIVKNTNDYTVTLKSKKIETVTKSKNITITYNKHYSVTLPTEITVVGEIDLTKVAENTEVEFLIAVPEGKTIGTLKENENDILETVNGELKFKVTITRTTTITVTFTEITFEQVVRDNEVTLLGLNENVTFLVVPSKIEGLPVTKLGRGFLKDNKHVKKVVLPSSLKEIGIQAFEDTKVTEVYLQEGLVKISEYAFYRSLITKITIPASVTEIGFNAFSKSSDLEDVTFKNSNFDLHVRMFYGTKFLDKNKNVDGLYIVNNVLIGAEIIASRALVIPANVTKIARNAFDKNTYTQDLVSVDFTNATNLVEIGDSAFFEQEELKSLDFPASLRIIGASAFMRAKKLETIKFNDGLQEIKGAAFYSATSITSITLPNSVTVLNTNVFGNAIKLASITADGLKEIKDGALYGTFFTRNQINNQKYAVLNGILYDTDKNSTVDFVVPSNVKVIAEKSFAVTKFNSITIPNTVETVEKNAVYRTLTPVITLGGFIKNVKAEALYITYKANSGTRLVITDVDSKPEVWDANFYKSIIGNKLVILWSPEVTINYDLQDGNANGGTFDSYVINKNQKATKPQVNPTKENFVFGGWLVKGNQFVFETTPVVQTITLVANWIAKSEDFNFEFNEEYGFTLVESLKKAAASVEIPSTFGNLPVTRIAENAFAGSTAVTSVVIPNSVTRIGDKAFYNVATLANITIHETVKSFGEEAFVGTAWLTQKRQEATNKVVVLNGILVDGVEATDEITVSDVKRVNGKAFKGSQVTKVTFTNVLVEIARNAFAEASELMEVVIPATIEYIGKDAFTNTKVGFVLNAETILYELDGFENGYDNDGRGGKVTVKFNPTAQFIQITVSIPGAIVPQNPKLKLEKIFKTDSEQVVLVVKTPEHHIIKTLTVNDEDYKDQLTEEGEFEITPDKNYNIVIEFDVKEEIKQAIETEKNKLGDKVGLSEVDNYDLITSVPSVLNNLVNGEVAEIKYLSHESNKVTVKVVSRVVPSYFVTVELDYHVYFDINKDLKIHKFSGQANNRETPAQLIDDSLNTKWCDVGSGQHYVIYKFDSPRLISKFSLVHAGEAENAGFITKKYDILVSTDGIEYEKVVEVRNNKTNRLTHVIKTVEVNYVKFDVLQGEQGGEGNSTARVYDFRVYGKEDRTAITVELNGGNYNGKTENVTMYPDKTKHINADRFNVFTKEFYVVDKVVDAISGEEINLNTTEFNAPKTIKIIWKVDPAFGAQMQDQIDKLYDPFVVETTNVAPTLEEIKQELTKKLNLDNLNLLLENVSGNKYKVTLQLRINTEIKVSREIIVLPRTPGETKQVTFKLNGGKLGENATEIVLTVLKGEKVTIPEGRPTKENYDFLGWILNGDVYDFNKVIVDNLTIEGTYSPSRDNIKAFKNEVVKIELNQGLDDLSTLTSELVQQKLGEKVNSQVVTLNVLLISGTTYKVTVTSVKCPELVKELEVKFEKNITVVVPEGIKVDGKTGTVTLVKDATYRLEVLTSNAYEISKILLKDVDITSQLFNNVYHFTAEEGMTIVFEKAFDASRFAEDVFEIEKQMKKIESFIKISVNVNELSKEVIENIFKTREYKDYNVEATLIEGNMYEIKVIRKNNPNIFRTKVVTFKNILVREGLSVRNSTTPSTNADEDRPNLIDYDANGKLNTDTLWSVSTDNQNIKIVLEYQEAKKVDAIRLVFAKSLSAWGTQYNMYPTGIKVYLGNDLGDMQEAYKGVNLNTKDLIAPFTPEYLSAHPEAIKYVKIEVTAYNSWLATLRFAGIELYNGYSEKSSLLTVDLNGGAFDNKEVIYKKYQTNSQLTGLNEIAPTKPNFTFVGFVDKDNQVVNETTQITEDMVVFAKWAREASADQTKFNVTIDLNGGNVNGNTEAVVIEVYNNEKVELSKLPKVEKDNFAFESFVKTDGQSFDFNQPITNNVQLKVKYYGDADYNQFITSKQLSEMDDVLDSDMNTLELVKEELESTFDQEKFTLDVVQVKDIDRYTEYKVTLSLIEDTSVTASKLIRVYKVINITKFAKVILSDDTYRTLTSLDNLTDTKPDGSQDLTTEFKLAQNEESNVKTSTIHFTFNKVLLTKVKIYLQNPDGEKHNGLNHTDFNFVSNHGYRTIYEIPNESVTNDFIEFDVTSNNVGYELRIVIKNQEGKLIRIHGIELFGIAY